MGSGHIGIILIIISVSMIPVFAQEMGWYENKLYDFSFDIPKDWRYYENYAMPDGSTFQTLQYPKEFDPIHSVFDSPNIFVKFENIPESKIPILNTKTIEKYELEELRVALPNARIINYDVKSTSYGWESTVEVVVSLNVPFVVRGEFHEEDKTFYFKDSREAYLVGYIAPVEYYDPYYHVYENVIDSLVIKSVEVPEFQEIALMVLGSSIVFVIVFARKFTKII